MRQRVLICGDRNWDNYEMLFQVVSTLHGKIGINLIISGGAKGADHYAEMAAQELWIPMEVHLAKWDLYGMSAGPIRNRKMLEGKPTLVLAFHNNLEKSKGTKHMVKIAKEAGVPVIVITEKGIDETNSTKS